MIVLLIGILIKKLFNRSKHRKVRVSLA